MDKKVKEDNIAENEMGDLIICDCNVSEIMKNNNKKYSDELFEAKRQRNKAERGKQLYKNAFGITLILIAIIVFLIGLDKSNEQSDKNIQDCINAGYSEHICYKSEGIY